MAVINVMYYINRIHESGRRFILLYEIEQFAELMATLYTFEELCVGGYVEYRLIKEVVWYLGRLIRNMQRSIRIHEMEDTFISELERMTRRLEIIDGDAYDDEYTSDSDEESESENEDNEGELYENEVERNEDVYTVS